jgi:hypothetical protein
VAHNAVYSDASKSSDRLRHIQEILPTRNLSEGLVELSGATGDLLHLPHEGRVKANKVVESGNRTTLCVFETYHRKHLHKDRSGTNSVEA